MAGIFCLLVPAGYPDGQGVISRLADASCFFPWQRVRTVEAETGRLFLGATSVENRQQSISAVFADDGDIVCAMEGHFTRARESCGVDALLTVPEYARAAIVAYRAFGPSFASRLEGPFTIVLYDRAALRLMISNSRHEQSPLYRWHRDGCSLFSSRLGPMGACGLFRPEIDRDAVAAYLSTGQVFNRDCLLKDVSVLESATVLEFDLATGATGERRYWGFADIGPHDESRDYAQHLDRTCELFEASADRMVAAPGRYVCGLSGGNDSRLVVGLAVRRRPELKTWTFGSVDARDMSVAAEISRVLGVEHLAFVSRPEDTPRYAEEYVTLVDGCCTLQFAHQMGRARALREHADRVLNGYGGNYLPAGGLLDLTLPALVAHTRYRLGLGAEAPHPRIEGNRDNRSIALFLRAKYGGMPQLSGLLTPRAPGFADIARWHLDSLGDAVPLHLRVEYWGWEQRSRRWTMMGLVRDRYFYSDCSAFYDYDVFDHCLRIPYRHRRHNRLYRDLMRRLIPQIAGMISSNTDLPATAPYGAVLARSGLRRLRTIATGRAPAYSTGSDIGLWIRTVLRDYYGSMFSDSRTVGRPFWDGPALRARLDEHMRGEVNWGPDFALAASVEVFHRKWIDPWQ
jgi:asparagine synthetase B (glutamine-hydrolysing)